MTFKCILINESYNSFHNCEILYDKSCRNNRDIQT